MKNEKKNPYKWPKITGGAKWAQVGQNGIQVGQNGTPNLVKHGKTIQNWV